MIGAGSRRDILHSHRHGSMQVLFATSEAAPLVKTGGLADVSGALPAALRREGVDVRILLPGYPSVLRHLGGQPTVLAEFDVPMLGRVALLEGAMPDGVPLYVIARDDLYARDGGPYQRADGADWPDNDRRFALLSRVAAMLSQETSPIAWRPDVLHCNDWQTGLAPLFLGLGGGWHARTLFTIHNLAYQGIFPAESLPKTGLPWDVFRMEGVEFFGNISFLKGGLQTADRITTVSPNYAREIQHEPLGFGMQGLLSWRAKDLTGILNGIDLDAWNPGTDPLIPRRYGVDSLLRKDANRSALRTLMGLEDIKGIPVAGLVTRFAHQKGLDLLLACIEEALALPMQFAILGSGDPTLEHAYRDLAARHPGRIGVRIGFDEGLSHLVEAGADLFVMPSRFEPCGLNQMYSQRYGTPVVAHATGGLADSIVDATPETVSAGEGTGFLFREPTPPALLAALGRAASAFADRRAWRRIQRAGMGRDFSWDAAARRYAALYRSVAGTP